MLIYCKHLNHQIYDDLRSSINNLYRINTNNTEDIIMNAVPIKYKNNYWIVSNLANLEISSLDLTKETYEIKYVIDEEVNGTILIDKVCSLHELYLINGIEDINCLYDEHLNIMFVKFQDVRIEYIDISNYEFKNFEEYEKDNLLFSWINNFFEKKTIVSSNNKIIYENKFLNLPSIPYIISNSDMIGDLINHSMINYPCTGAAVFNDVGDFLGIASYINDKEIVTTPVNLIKRSLNYMDGHPLYKFNYELFPIKIILKNALGVDITEYGLYYVKKEKNESEEIHNIILSIDEHPVSVEGELLINNYSVPVSTYLWLFKNEKNVKIKVISPNSFKNARINNEREVMWIDCRFTENLRFNHYNMKLSSNSSDALSVSKLNFVKYNKKYLIEINEKIMQILKIIIMTTDKFDELYDYINENKFIGKKIVVMIDDNANIKIIQKIKNTVVNNLDTIIKHYKTENALKKYISNI